MRDATRSRCSGSQRMTSRFSTTKLFHAYGLGNGLTFPLWFGATSVLMRGPTRPSRSSRRLRKHRPDGLLLGAGAVRCDRPRPRRPTARWTRCASACRRPRRCRRTRSSAGGPASASTSSMGSARPRCSTSTAPTVPARSCRGTTGWPVPGYELRLVDRPRRRARGSRDRRRSRCGATPVPRSTGISTRRPRTRCSATGS